MSFLSPNGFWFLGLLAPLVVLYILKVKRQRRRVASTWLWATAQRDLMAKAPFKRLIAQVPLLLQALVLILLAVAVARPATRGQEFLGDHVAMVIDVSASMSVIEDAPPGAPEVTRLDQAKQAAHDLLDSLPPGSDAMVLAAGRGARLVSPLDRDRVRVKSAIDAIEGGQVEGDLGASIALAVDRLRQLGGSRRLIVITDGFLANPESLRDVGLPLDVVTVGQAKDNAAIIRVDVRSGQDPTDDREQVQAFLMLQNFGSKPRELYVTMRQENASDVLSSRRVLIPPGERTPVVLTFTPSKADHGRGLVLDVSPRDAMPVDDVAYARIPRGDKLPVVIASDDGKPSAWLQRALASDPRVALTRTTTSQLLDSTGLDPGALVVFDGVCPASPPGGDMLIVNPPAGPCHRTTVGDELSRPPVTSWDTADPRMRFLSLDGLHVATARLLSPEGKSQELVRTQAGPIVTDISTAARSGTLVGFDVGQSDWPLQASFVLFVRNLLEQARLHRNNGLTGPARVGQPMRVTLPISATDVTVTDPLGKEIAVVAPGRRGASAAARTEGLVILPHVERVGLYRFAWQGAQAGTMVVPANLTSVAESDVRQRTLPSESSAVSVRSSDDRPDAHNEWVWVLALCALAFIVFDVWYFTRPLRARIGGVVGPPPAPQRNAP